MVSLLSLRSVDVPWKFSFSWQHCLYYLSSMSVHVSHIYREGNAVADCLTSHGRSLAQDF